MWRVTVVLAVLAFTLLAAGFNYLRPVDPVQPTQIVTLTSPVPGDPPSLPWPDGEAALGVAGLGLVASHGEDVARPMASIAKVMTALMVVADHPLTPIDAGPSVIVTADDVSAYHFGRRGRRIRGGGRGGRVAR